MYTNTRAQGNDIANPDVCLVGPIPTSYINLGLRNQALPSYYTITITNAPILNTQARIPITSGDESGINGGVISHSVKGQSVTTIGSTILFVGGFPVTRMNDPTSQNMLNAMGSSLTPSQNIQSVFR